MSIAGGIWKALPRGVEEGCTTVQIFTKNASQWEAPPLSKGDILRFRESLKSSGIDPVFAHDAYLINLASPSATLRARSRKAFLEEMRRAEALGLPYLVTHPGAHTGSGAALGLRRIAESLDWLHDRTRGFSLVICLENTAGQGSVLGGDFAHFAEIFGRVRDEGRLGICLDTCHAFAAGYDLREEGGYTRAMGDLEGAVGKGRVKVVHTNDAKGELGGRRDRHEHLGRGSLGLEAFRLVMNDRRLREVPKVLETPKEERGLPMDRVNLAVLRELEGREKVPSRLLERVERCVAAAVAEASGEGRE